ncbi:hypothetical protein KJ969_05190 [Patescibacteria group bacterium]|nr:hypothetical protein [Patescibacteria group bacterium]MBU1921617.1 hypothetical protein [Patescibacteria group bacterium]
MPKGELRKFVPDSARYTGREYQMDVFGPNNQPPEFFQAIKQILSSESLRVAEEILKGSHIPSEAERARKQCMKEIWKNRPKMIELMKEYSLADPVNPRQDFLRELRLEVIDKLGLKTDEGMDRVKAYSSVDTPLDAIGMDGFLTYETGGKKSRKSLVTLDATLNPKKVEKAERGEVSFGADIVFGQIPDPDEDEEAYLSAVSRIADKAVKIIRKQIGA